MPGPDPVAARRVLLHLDDGRRVPLDPAEIFLLEAQGDETVVRTRGRRPLRDVRSLGELMRRVPPGVFVLIHRALAVNVDRVAEVRRRPGERDWELRLEAPVNRILPVARGRAESLWAAYGEKGADGERRAASANDRLHRQQVARGHPVRERLRREIAMALAAWVGRERFELGEPTFLKAFFSTVFVKLEDEDWGRRFPVLMREVYAGRLSHEQAPAAAQEIGAVRAGLEAFKPDELVWDFEDRSLQPPWGDSISPHITSLGNYFVTSEGKDLFDVLQQALVAATHRRQDVIIR